jgi:hypothetical protein
MISRYTAEIATATATAAVGLVTLVGALEFGIGWSMTGPEPGAFPFYIGILIVLASLATMAKTVMERASFADLGFLDGDRLRRIGIYFALMSGFVLMSVYLGLYVASVVYMVASMWWQGRYRLWVGAACGVTTALFFYVVLERAFQVPLLKGPLEAAFGIY